MESGRPHNSSSSLSRPFPACHCICSGAVGKGMGTEAPAGTSFDSVFPHTIIAFAQAHATSTILLQECMNTIRMPFQNLEVRGTGQPEKWPQIPAIKRPHNLVKVE